MLEHRFVIGHKPLADDLNLRLWEDLFQGTEREFVAAKLAERDSRHEKQGERYLVEPNVKEGKGGLRDLQSLFWIVKYVHGTDDVRHLVRKGVFRPEEYETFVAAERFLWAVRHHLHLVAGRPMNSSPSTCRSRWPHAWAMPTRAGAGRWNGSCRTISATLPRWAT